MTKKREPIDLVGRLASRLNLPPEVAAEPPSPPIVMRTATVNAPIPAPLTSEPRVVGREPPRIDPVFVRAAEITPAPLREAPRPHLVTELHSAPAAAAAGEAAPSPPETPAVAREDVVIDASAASPEMPTVSAATDAVERDTGPDSKHVELNFVRLHKEGFLTPQNQRSLIAEEYRIIKRPLLRSAFDHSNGHGNLNHVVMVTSARPGEGKTFTAINLAMSVATERDLFVLLVDCDIRRMGLSKKLGLADRKGLMDVLTDSGRTLGDVIVRTNVPNLAVIPAGHPIEAATEIFASAKMTQLVDEIASRYADRFIIFDAPPVLASSEPGVLAVHVGQTVMVVHANETSKRAIAQSIPLINGCPNVHFVLNRVTLAAGPDRFGYYGTY